MLPAASPKAIWLQCSVIPVNTAVGYLASYVSDRALTASALLFTAVGCAISLCAGQPLWLFFCGGLIIFFCTGQPLRLFLLPQQGNIVFLFSQHATPVYRSRVYIEQMACSSLHVCCHQLMFLPPLRSPHPDRE